jgi:hypothetical protein
MMVIPTVNLNAKKDLHIGVQHEMMEDVMHRACDAGSARFQLSFALCSHAMGVANTMGMINKVNKPQMDVILHR